MSEPERVQPPRRRRSRRRQRTRRIALLLVLLAIGVGAAVFAPGLVQIASTTRPVLKRVKAPARVTKPIRRPAWKFDFSMGPILELVEQSLNLRPFDLRRPVRIPVPANAPQPRADDILLADPGSYNPPFVPGHATPVNGLRGPLIASLPKPPPIVDPTSGIPTGAPFVSPELYPSDFTQELAPPGHKPKTDPPKKKSPPPPPVPEPATGLLLVAALLALAARRR